MTCLYRNCWSQMGNGILLLLEEEVMVTWRSLSCCFHSNEAIAYLGNYLEYGKANCHKIKTHLVFSLFCMHILCKINWRSLEAWFVHLKVCVQVWVTCACIMYPHELKIIGQNVAGLNKESHNFMFGWKNDSPTNTRMVMNLRFEHIMAEVCWICEVTVESAFNFSLIEKG